MADRGRPTKCTPEVIERVSGYVREGNHFVVAARASGISLSAFYDWKARGQADRDSGNASPFADFLEAVERAEADAELAALANIRAAAADPKHWTAAAWLLERRFGDRWLKRSETEPTEVRVVVVDETADADLAGSDRLAAARESVTAAISAGAGVLDRYGQAGRENGRRIP